jgi:hypothetical protein
MLYLHNMIKQQQIHKINMIKQQQIHKIDKYYISIHKRTFLNKNMICIKMFLFLFKRCLF